MKPLWRQVHLQDGQIGGQHRIQCPVEVGQTVPPHGGETNNLPTGMNPTVGPASSHYSRLGTGNRFDRPLDLSLNRSLCSLDLEAVKVRAVILDPGPELPWLTGPWLRTHAAP